MNYTIGKTVVYAINGIDRQTDVPLPFDFLKLCQPGIYRLYNKVTKKVYYGESQNVASRLSQHYYQLQAGIHFTISLQDDWNSALHKFKESNFLFEIIEIGPDWEDISKRRLKEKELIESSSNVYNRPPVLFESNKLPPIVNSVTVNGILFDTLKEAASKHQITIAKAVQLIETPGSGWFYVNNVSALKNRKKYAPHSKKVKVDYAYGMVDVNDYAYGMQDVNNEKLFNSISEAARFYNIAPTTVVKRIHSKNFPAWAWGDQPTIKAQTKSHPRAKPVAVDGQFFSSIQEAADFFQINRTTVFNRCLSNSNKFKDWKFLN